MAKQLYTGLQLGVTGPAVIGKNAVVQVVADADASNLVVAIFAGLLPDGSDATEVESEGNPQVTRRTLTANQVVNYALTGLTPGTYITAKKISGTGSGNYKVLTAHDNI